MYMIRTTVTPIVNLDSLFVCNFSYEKIEKLYF